jgi:hypothetical protein
VDVRYWAFGKLQRSVCVPMLLGMTEVPVGVVVSPHMSWKIVLVWVLYLAL